MIDSAQLTSDLKKVVLRLEDDLRDRVEHQPEVLDRWRAEHSAAMAGERTASSWQAWRDDRVTMAAAAWVLTSVFVRFCEDNALVRPVWLAGPAERRQEALDAELAYFRQHPERTSREWLEQAVGHLASLRATTDLVDDRSPIHTVSPSGEAAADLLTFWRRTADTGALVHDFTDPDLSTRFLGDLYQDLSEHARKTYALLQTPEFVEEFILDHAMEPALDERPLEGFTMIDPACGSGHFLLGAFRRLDDRWARQAPGMDARERVATVLAAIHGVDLNPFAVAIARFRLMVAALQACGETSLEDAPDFRFNVAAGDSLLHGHRQTAMSYECFDADAELSGLTYSTEDRELLDRILEPGRYDVVVANPPYITVKDRVLNEAYRALYPTCRLKYALTVPFMERIFSLAKPAGPGQSAGWTGQITSNSFMKREFGSKVIEEFLSHRDLKLVVDSSGAYIPGHGTPTVILTGRNQRPSSNAVRAVLGVRGEPGQPADPAQGLVWSSIRDHAEDPDFENSFVSVVDAPRSTFASHPWSLAGGGASELTQKIEAAGVSLLGPRTHRIGVFGIQGSDDSFIATRAETRAKLLETDYTAYLTLGDQVRDFTVTSTLPTWFPYTRGHQLRGVDEAPHWRKRLWPLRAELGNRATFGGTTYIGAGRAYYEWHQLPRDRGASPLTITFAFVATHNHFVLDRGGKVFNRSAPVIKLPEGATEDDHLALLGVLNSSTACFWLKQQSYPKSGENQPWAERYEFTGTTLEDYPLPVQLPLERARALDRDATALAAVMSGVVSPGTVPTLDALERARTDAERIRARMIAVQDELDWEVYAAYGLTPEPLTYHGDDLPGLALGERAFEIALARRLAAGTEESQWFSRHGSVPITELPTHWPAGYRDLVQRRLDLMASDRNIGLLERPEFKRRWATEPWDKQVERALSGWLLDRLEDRAYWFDAQGRPVARSVAQLADLAERDADLVSVLRLWSGRKDRTVTQDLGELLASESVPFLAAHRLKDSGLRKRESWEHTWDLQRREDAGERVGPIPVPTKYTSADFRKATWWQHRGKLDVPKERFISYPDASRSTDPTELLGWAGWDHAQQALALAMIVAEREGEGWSDDALVPLVAGIAELAPWVRQWHDTTDPTYDLNLAEYIEEELHTRAAQVGRTLDELRAWRPSTPTRGRRPRKA